MFGASAGQLSAWRGCNMGACSASGHGGLPPSAHLNRRRLGNAFTLWLGIDPPEIFFFAVRAARHALMICKDCGGRMRHACRLVVQLAGGASWLRCLLRQLCHRSIAALSVLLCCSAVPAAAAAGLGALH